MTAPQKLEKIGRYKVLEKVGKGGMGVLYRGFDPVLDREVAIKLMHADFSEDTEQMRPRFYREARAAAKLNHRNIVTIFEFAEESNVPYIVMEFLKGTPLGARMNAQPPLTLDDKLNVVAQLCDGLSYAHEQGVVHRDVKPDNVFLLEDGQVKLLDFGIAKLTSSTLTRQGDVLGSASYMSPEQVGGSESVDGRADVFSAGVVLYELLAGQKPFTGDSPTAVILKILKEDPAPLDGAAKGVPPEVLEIVMHALKKDPAERFPSAEAMSRALQSVRKSIHPSLSTPTNAQMDETRFASTQVMKALHADYQKSRGVNASDTKVTHDVPPEPPSRGWMMPAIGAAVLVLAVGGYFMFSGGDEPPAPTTTSASPSTPSGSGSTPASGSSSGAASTTGSAASPAASGGSAPASAASSPASSGSTPPGAEPPAATPAAAANAPASASTTSTAPTTTAAAATRPPAAATRPPAAPAALIGVTLTGGYPFEVVDGSRTISPAATSHDLKLPAGKSIVLRARDRLLNQTVRVEGSANEPFAFGLPGLGRQDIRSDRGDCDIVISTVSGATISKNLGPPPVVGEEIAAGSYKVDVSCGGSVAKSQYVTIRTGPNSPVVIR